MTLPAGPALRDIRTHGAVGDGLHDDGPAIQQALDACAADGGGTVRLGPGRYVAGTLRLRSGVHLRIEAGAVLQATTDLARFAEDTGRQRYDFHANMDRAWIHGAGLRDVALTGEGTIDGRSPLFANASDDPRPVMLRLEDCEDVRVEGLALRDSATWATAFVGCRNVRTTGLRISTRGNHNGNGLVFDGCRDVIVSGCTVDASDDAICLQSSDPATPCRRVTISNCILSSAYAAIKIGMLSYGDIEDVVVTGCVFHDLGCSGLKILSAEGGRIRNLVFGDLVMRNVPRPVFVALNRHRVGRPTPLDVPRTGAVQRLRFHDVLVDNDEAQPVDPTGGIVVLGGPDQPVEDIAFARIDLRMPGGVADPDCGRSVPELGTQRPEYHAFRDGLPAFGAYLRHVRGARLEDVRVSTLRPDARAPVAFDDVRDLRLDRSPRPSTHPEG